MNTTTTSQALDLCRRSLELLHDAGTVFEIRVLDGKKTISGYFSDLDRAAEAAIACDARKPDGGVYVTINPCTSSLLARSDHTMTAFPKKTTSDLEIARRFWLPIDLDPERPSGIPASDAERQAATERSSEIEDKLRDRGWSYPLLADSGNGRYLLYRIDLLNDDEATELIKRFYAGLDTILDPQSTGIPVVKIDRTLFNASRILRVGGTGNVKGTGSHDRQNRRCEWFEPIEECPVMVVDRALIEAVAALAPVPEAKKSSASSGPKTTSANGYSHGRLNLDRYLSFYGREYIIKDVKDGVAYRIICPFDPNHGSAGESAIYQAAGGLLTYECKHDSCTGRRWEDVKAAIGQPAADHFDGRSQQQRQQTNGKPESKPAPPPAPYVPFPVECLPEPIRSFVLGGAKSIGCDPSFIALPVLSMAAAAIGNTRRLCIKRGWIEPAILWTCIVGDSGSSKSPALELALRPIRQRQQKAIQLHRELMQEFEDDSLVYERDVASWKRSKTGGDPPEQPTKPIAERLWCDDQTVEALALMLQQQPRGMLLAKDELAGWLGGMDQYKGGQGSDVSRWLEMFGGRQMIYDRKTGDHRTIFVPMASMSITGGVQPEVLARSLGRAYFENGLAARLLLAFPPRQKKRWTEADIDPDLELQMAALIDALYGLQPGTDESGDLKPLIVGMNSAAKAAWIEFYNEHAAEQMDMHGDLSAAWSKLEGYAARLALVVHFIRVVAADRSLTTTEAVDQSSIEAGIKLSRWFGSEARRVYGIVGETDDDRDTRRLIDWIERRGGDATIRDVQQGCRWLKETGLAEAALMALVKAGIGSWIEIPAGVRGGRPVRVFRLSTASTSTEPH